MPMETRPPDDFEEIARQQREGSLVGELWLLLRASKKWWLLPVLVLLLLFGFLLMLSGSGAAPFLYTLF
jgi:hypothetical protein